MSKRLSEDRVSNAFHTYLKYSLAQARSQQLLDAEMLSSAEADIMIAGPALCLHFAALRSTTSPPSVPLPPSDNDDEPVDLTADNCPRPFIGFMETWACTVPIIQNLPPEYQHDLARIICGLEPHTSPLHPEITRISAELRAVAIEISQRRSFQDRYASDLQAALEASGGGSRVVNFVPPPMYDPSPSSSISPSPNSQTIPLPPTPPPKSEFLSPPATPLHPTSPRSHSQPRTRTPSPAPSSHLSPPPSPSFAVDAPSIQLIRETLYASLADVIARHRHVHHLLKSDPPRAYFAAVGLAILDVASTRTRVLSSSNGIEPRSNAEPDVEVDGVLGAKLSLSMCPRPLHPFMRELCMIGVAVRAAEEEDTMIALQALSTDSNATLPTPRMERVRRILERGVGSEHRRRHSRSTHSTDDDDEDDEDEESEQESRRRSIEGRAITLANRINALALGMLKLRAFRDRQNEIFKILASIIS